MRYRENTEGAIEIVTPMGTLTLSGQMAYSGTLKETEGNWEEVLKTLQFERKDKRDIMGSIRQNLLRVQKDKNAMALQHLQEISKEQDVLKDLKLKFYAWKQEQHCKDKISDDALNKAKTELNTSMTQENKHKQALEDELDRVKRRDATIKDLELKPKEAGTLNSKQLATIESKNSRITKMALAFANDDDVKVDPRPRGRSRDSPSRKRSRDRERSRSPDKRRVSKKHHFSRQEPWKGRHTGYSNNYGRGLDN